jgi:hypothetical protein
MKAIVPPVLPPVGEGKSPPVFATIIREMVLTLAYWKGGELPRVEAMLEIDEALNADGSLLLADDTANMLAEAMRLQMPNGGSAQIQDPYLNRCYMLVFRAVLRADKVNASAATG